MDTQQGTTMIQIGSKLKSIALAIVGALLTVAAIFMKGRSAGKKAEQVKELRKELKTQQVQSERIEKANQTATEISALPSSDVDKRLRDKWTRPD